MSAVRPRVFVEQLGPRVGETVTVHGWIDTLRLQRRMQFVLVRDRTGLVQVTHRRGGAGDPIEAAFDAVTLESAVRITGRVVADSAVKLGGLELVPESVEVVAAAEPGLPIDERTGLDRRLDWRFLDVRRPSRQLLFAAQTTVERAMRDFAYEQGCVELHTPKLMGSASESGAEVFAVEYFGRQAYLAQSPQFFKQMAIAGGLDRVFEIGPVFRAEPSFTSRHSTEFTGVDVELAWIEDVGEVMAFEERMLHRVLTSVRAEHGERIAEQFGVEVVVPELPFPRITMAQALERLRAHGWEGPADASDLDPAGERMLSGC